MYCQKRSQHKSWTPPVRISIHPYAVAAIPGYPGGVYYFHFINSGPGIYYYSGCVFRSATANLIKVLSLVGLLSRNGLIYVPSNARGRVPQLIDSNVHGSEKGSEI